MGKRRLLLITAALLAMTFAAGSAADDDDREFSNRDFRGEWAFFLTGEATQGPLVGPLAGVGLIVSDGDGNIEFATRTVSIGGVVVVQNDEAVGTYTIEPDGRGTLTFLPTSGAPPETFDVVLINSRRLYALTTGPGIVGHGEATRQRR